MVLLQLNVDSNLKKAIQKKATLYGVPVSSLIRIVLVRSFLDKKENEPGNVFNAERDNGGQGIKVDDFLDQL